MCGIAGLFVPSKSEPGLLSKATLKRMTDTIAHRGPDADGFWLDKAAGIGLGHRRLSIVDLSEAGAQPMSDDKSRFTIAFNGEIYNHLDLRAELESDGPRKWRGHSDTETLLEAIATWGLVEALRRANGMFALAVWDADAATLSLARDRMGEKPLYVARRGAGCVFASEMRAITILDDAPRIVDQRALASMVASGAVPDQACALAGLQKIQPGTILQFSARDETPRQVIYEDFSCLLEQGKSCAPACSTQLSDTASANKIEAVLREVIGSHMMSDVPLGCFLSGGVDSSLVATLMQDSAGSTVKTFSIGFDDKDYDESLHAEAVAAHLGTEHHTFQMREEDLLNIVPSLARVYDEPFADSSQLPTLLLCHKARAHVTVALTGDGGDEVFGGYNRYLLAPKLWSRLSGIPPGVRRAAPVLGKLLHRVAQNDRSAIARWIGLSGSVINKAPRLGEVASNSRSLADVYLGLTRQHDNVGLFLHSGTAPLPGTDWDSFGPLAPEERMMALDSVGYLPSDILVKVDRAAMNASLETRAPFLDARTVRAAWALPLSSRIRGNTGKKLLRDILYRYVPKSLIERPKQGFAVPIDAWLKGALRDWAEDLLSIERLRHHEVLEPDPVRAIWQDHIAGQANHGQLLWSLLMLQQWLAEHESRHNG